MSTQDPRAPYDHDSDDWGPNGKLGNDPQFARPVGDDISKAVDESLGLQPISIRLQRALIEDLKALGQLNNLGYQPLIRQILTRFVECEKRNMARSLHGDAAPCEAEPERRAA